MNHDRVAIIGAGWAGLTTALRLAEAGRNILLLEAGAVPGGRARTLEVAGTRLDNGQHILVGACRQVQAQMLAVGVDPERVLLALPFGLLLRETGQPAFTLEPRSVRSWSLAAALSRALPEMTVWARLGMLAGAARMLHQSIAEDLSVQEWLVLRQQPPPLIRKLWEPLCLAVMNARPDAASARVFQNVLRLTLLGSEEDARLLIPRVPLGEVFPEPALNRLQALGAEVRMRTRVTALQPGETEGFRLRLRGSEFLDARQVVLATSPRAAERLLPAGTEPTRQRLQALGGRTICTVYLRYPRPLKSLPPLTGLLGQVGQWVLPQETSGRQHWASVVISDAEVLRSAMAAGCWQRVARELAGVLADPDFPVEGHRICERLATIDSRPGIDARRPGPETGAPGLFLAGDYCVQGLPSTLEAAVRGGMQAAQAVLAHAGAESTPPGQS